MTLQRSSESRQESRAFELLHQIVFGCRLCGRGGGWGGMGVVVVRNYWRHFLLQLRAVSGRDGAVSCQQPTLLAAEGMSTLVLKSRSGWFTAPSIIILLNHHPSTIPFLPSLLQINASVRLPVFSFPFSHYLLNLLQLGLYPHQSPETALVKVNIDLAYSVSFI